MPNRLITQTFTGPFYGVYAQPSAPRALRQGFWAALHNLVLKGAMAQLRPGIAKVNTSPFGSTGNTRMHGFGIFRTTSLSQLVVASGDKIQIMTLPAGEPTNPTFNTPTGSPYTVRTGSRTVFSSLGGEIFIVNGVDGNLKYNGTSVRKMGMTNPTTLSAPTKSGGALTLTANYVATFVSGSSDSFLESGASPALSVTYAAQQGAFTAPSIGGDPQNLYWNLYRQVGGGGGIYYRVNSSPVLVANSIADNNSDSTLQLNRQLPASIRDGLALPPTGPFTWIADHASRMCGVYAANRNVLYYSDIGTGAGGIYFLPEYWPTNNFYAFPETGGPEITGGISFHEWFIVFQDFGVWAIENAFTANASITKLFVAPGSAGAGIPFISNAVVNEDAVLFAAKDGIYSISREQIGNTPSLKLDKISGNITELYRTVDFSQGGVSVYDRDFSDWLIFGIGAS